MADDTSQFFDSGMRDLLYGLVPGEVIACDAGTRAVIESSGFLEGSRFGPEPDAKGPKAYLSPRRAHARRDRIESGIPPPTISVDDTITRTPGGVERVYVATAAKELQVATFWRSRHPGHEVLSVKNDAHALLRVPSGFDQPLEQYLGTSDDAEIEDLVIAAVPRSGSYLLAEYLSGQGLGIGEEHLKEDVAHAVKLSRRDFSFLHWLRSLRRGGHVDGRFATKFMSHYWWRLHKNLPEADREALGHWLRGATVVVIDRRDRVLQAVSSYVSMATRVYRLRSTSAAEDYLPEVEYNGKAIATRYEWGEGQYRRLSRLMTEYGVVPLVVAYEDLVADPVPLIEQISREAGVQPSVVDVPVRNRQMRTGTSLEFAERFRRDFSEAVANPQTQVEGTVLA